MRPNGLTGLSRLGRCISYPTAVNNGNVILVTDTSDAGLLQPSKDNLGVLVLQLQMMVNQAPTSPGGAFLVTMTMNTVPNATVPNSLMAIVTGSVTVNSPGAGTGGTTVKVRKLAETAEAIQTNTAMETAHAQ